MSEAVAGKAIYQLSNFIKRWNKVQTEMSSPTQSQINVLGYVVMCYGEKEICQKDIANEFQLRPATVTAIVDELEKKKLVERKMSVNDGRLKIIVPTEISIKTKPQIIRQIREFEDKMTEGIDEEELATFLRVTAKIAENLKL